MGLFGRKSPLEKNLDGLERVDYDPEEHVLHYKWQNTRKGRKQADKELNEDRWMPRRRAKEESES